LRKKGIDVPQLVAGLSSYSLWASGGNLVDQAKKQGVIPIYVAQTVRQYKGIETVKPGDKISITTAARVAEETTRKRAARRGFEKITATTPARMVTDSGLVVVQEDLTLAFTKEQTIDEQLEEILANQA
ncbi:MAG TPA: hypothetical protein VI612_04905, partial [Candidatus Nanoarchaeia archaeon]|nr:hypothetical protein [Candidatus Nanoarchaeia archaeon]